MKRIFDLFLSLNLIIILFPLIIIIFFVVKVTSDGPAFHFSKRIGLGNKTFMMPKFRTMKLNVPNVATHLLKDVDKYFTPIGRFLRKTSLDELPQIFSIIIGDMSFVGPRPALFNQYDLILLRQKLDIDTLMPGITGWAQINGRDNITIKQKVELDMEYMKNKSFYFDIYILWLTIIRVVQKENVKH